MNKPVSRLLLATLLFQPLLHLSSAAAAPPHQTPDLRIFLSYTVQVLPLDSAAGMANGIIVGRANGVGVVYVNGQVVPLPGKPGYTDIQPTGISSNGYIVGFATSANNTRGLFWPSYTNSPFDMGALGAVTRPAAVNSQGVAVGAYYQTSIYDLPQAFAWSMSLGMRSIAPPLSNQSEAFDISDSGYVAGFAWYGLQQAATRWYPGTFQAGTAAYGDFARKSLENGTIFGYGVAWDLSNHPQTIAPTPAGYVYDMSEVGRRVGTNLFQVPRRAWTVAPNSTSVQILPVPNDAVDTYANNVDSCGAILGQVSHADGTTRAVLWTKILCDQMPVYLQSR